MARRPNAMQHLLERLRGDDADDGCRCAISTAGRTLAADARDCDGDLATAPACRTAVGRAATGTDATRLRVRSAGADRFYGSGTLDLLRAAARFADLARDDAPELASRALRDPIATARDAAARAAPVDEIAAETGLQSAAAAVESPFEPAIAPVVADARVASSPPADGRLRTSRELSTGATARVYDVPGHGTAVFHVTPVEATLDAAALATLAAAYERLAEDATVDSPAQAVRAEDPDASVRTLAAVLRKHTRGYGVLEDCFADPAVTDVYASGPATETPLWVVADGEQLRTNVTLAEDGVAALASKLRRESGRSFSRAAPTIDATARIADERVRVAGVLEPATDGHAFAFRSGGEDAFTLPALVANGTLTARAAGLLSVAVRRSVAGLVAGTRGAGKTTLLGALLWELPATTRTIVVEDTPELPVGVLQDRGRDAQPLRTTLADGPGVSPSEALRTALRLGESALVLGEVRGEEAAVLYEAMRVGASGETVLGTIHGDGAADVRERVVEDLGVAPSSFGATDLVVTCEQHVGDDGERTRRVAAIEEVRGGGDARFAPLFEVDGDGLASTGLVERGNSELLQSLTRPGETYGQLRERVRRRAAFLGNLAGRGTTAPEAVTTAYARFDGDRP